MKPTVVFPLVEAGLGHIMPMDAVRKVFEEKYGDKVNVIRTHFFSQTNDPILVNTEKALIEEVKKHNKQRGRGLLQFLMMDIIGGKNAMKVVLEVKYKQALKPALEYIESFDADVIFNTHFSTLYYACKSKEDNNSHTKVVAYCPDPILGRQWDKRSDQIFMSSRYGVKDAESRGFKESQLNYVPFLIRKEVEQLDKGREFYREQLGLPKDNFTILLADGAYGAGKLKKTIFALLNANKKMTLVPVCGRNEELYQELLKVVPNENITLKPYGFTDKMLELSASCDLFIGKAGASNLAEPCYFKAPQIISFCATPIEDWIADYYIKELETAVMITNPKQIVKTVEEWIENPSLMEELIKNTERGRDSSGAEKMADALYELSLKAFSERENNKG